MSPVNEKAKLGFLALLLQCQLGAAEGVRWAKIDLAPLKI